MCLACCICNVLGCVDVLRLSDGLEGVYKGGELSLSNPQTFGFSKKLFHPVCPFFFLLQFSINCL